MTAFERGNVVLVRFVFSDGTGSKLRPALVVSSSEYQEGRQEVIILAITSNVERLLPGDYRIEGWREAGLILPSVATGIIRTIKQSMIEKTLGIMPQREMQAIEDRCA